jgi:hypothetical protein
MQIVPGRQRRPVGFVAHLQSKQQELKLRHGPFVRLLGIDRSWWYRLRTGEVEPSFDLAQRVLRLWPGEFESFLPGLVLGRETEARRSQGRTARGLASDVARALFPLLAAAAVMIDMA